ncbi:unnamed protein product [Rotaria magnacalcarata]|uniref:Homeobox domain-containing protein n=1 Tax=Rotaria magnacalcarata TaxID=392030 RepID=A0A816SM38_9BILA|nr:unnamed protein product [Rotaria magnacalcarata]CAF3999944.1 unnamed protein product [Rotaria magnacalcarata]
MNTNYPSIISLDHESNSRLYETSYNSYSPYTEFTPPPPVTSKLEAFDYNYWPGTPTTHNILAIPPPLTTNATIDQMHPSPSTSQTLETLAPHGSSSVYLSQINSTATIAATHHHHHIHQHLYAAASSSNDSSNWLPSTEYQTPDTYRHCTYANNSFYDQSQWATPTPSLPSIKFESPYSPQSYFESSNNLDQPLSDSKAEEEPSSSSYSKCQEQQNWFKSQLTPTPPKNPVNGKTRTRDKYRIVYTDRQRYELENEFNVSKYISIPRKAALSSALALSERQIKIWFQNRRAKERKLHKKRHDISSRQLNNSTDADSTSDAGVESPTYYQTYS